MQYQKAETVLQTVQQVVFSSLFSVTHQAVRKANRDVALLKSSDGSLLSRSKIQG